MVKSNEFTGATLFEAARNATAAYDGKVHREFKNQRECNDLILQITALQRELGRLTDEIESLEDEAERLRDSAKLELALTVLAAISSLSGAFRAARIIMRRLRKRDPRKLSEREILDLLSLFGPIGSAAAALHAASQLREAQSLARRAEEIERNGERLGDEMLMAVEEYRGLGCGGGGRVTS